MTREQFLGIRDRDHLRPSIIEATRPTIDYYLSSRPIEAILVTLWAGGKQALHQDSYVQFCYGYAVKIGYSTLRGGLHRRTASRGICLAKPTLKLGRGLGETDHRVGSKSDSGPSCTAITILISALLVTLSLNYNAEESFHQERQEQSYHQILFHLFPKCRMSRYPSRRPNIRSQQTFPQPRRSNIKIYRY